MKQINAMNNKRVITKKIFNIAPSKSNFNI